MEKPEEIKAISFTGYQSYEPSSYCVECYPKMEGAHFIYNGEGLCEECFKKIKYSL